MTDAQSLPAFADQPGFTALARVRTPKPARFVGRVCVAAFLLFPIALVFVPWQQTVRGRGQVVAFAPTERKQVVTALVGGQVRTWHVVEGSRVKAGDPIADIDDNDPGLAERLEAQRIFLQDRLKAAAEEIAQLKQVVAAEGKAMSAAVGAAKADKLAAEHSVAVAKEAKKNNEFAATFEQSKFEMFDKLYKNSLGLESELNRNEAKAKADQAATNVKRAQVEIERADASVLSAEAEIDKAEADGLSKIAKASQDLHKAEQSRFSVQQSIQELDTRIERYKARFVKAPTDGIVFRVSANTGTGGQYVKEGDELAVIVPDVTDRVVELMIDGLDAPLIAAHMEQTGRGPHVRLQFEGWPAVQFTGWPSVAVGTFGGRVRQMDPTDDGMGRFRVLVEPEEMFEGDTWPEGIYLRQGNAAIGWVFLNEVTIGYELWRQFNGFPPVIAPSSPGGKGNKSKDPDAGKPPKIKVG